MYSYNRRQYISKEPEKKIETPISESTENNNFADLKLFTTESIKLLSENINEMKNSIKKLDDKLTDLAMRIVSLENHIDLEEKYEKIQNLTEYNTIRNKLNSPKNNVCYNKQTEKPENDYNIPLMPGSCFSNVTADYLKTLSKNK